MASKSVRKLFLNNFFTSFFYFLFFIFSSFPHYFEHGLTKKMYNCMKSNSKMFYQKTTKIFDSLDEYVKDGYSGFNNLDLINFHTIFVVYFSLLFFYLVLFVITSLRKYKLFSKCFSCVKGFLFLMVRFYYNRI